MYFGLNKKSRIFKMNPQLKSSIAVGQTYQLQQLIHKGVDTNARDAHKRTPLILAAKQGSLAIFQLLHRAKADIHECDGEKRSPFHYATAEGHLDIVKYLFGFLERLECDTQDSAGDTPLMLAAQAGHMDICKLLLKRVHADVNAVNIKRQTALHLATEGGHEFVARLLIRYGVTVDRRDDQDTMHGETALMYAAHGNHGQVLGLLLHHGADITKLNKHGHTAMTIACEAGHKDIVEQILHHFKNSKFMPWSNRAISTLTESPLVAAANNGHVEIIEMLLKVNITKYLSVAVVNATHAGQIDVVKLLVLILLHPVNYKFSDMILVPKIFQDMFFIAVARNHLDIVTYLMETTPVEVNGWSDKGKRAIHDACSKGHTKIVEFLLKKGANLTCREQTNHKTPLLIAATLGFRSIVKLIVSKALSSDPTTSQDILTTSDGESLNALQLAVIKGHPDIIKLLIDTARMDVFTTAQNKQTLLHLAMQYSGNKSIYSVIAILVSRGASFRRHNSLGDTPFHSAVQSGDIGLVWYLLDQPWIRDDFHRMNPKQSLSVLQMTIKQSAEDLSHLLLEHGAPQVEVSILLASDLIVPCLTDGQREMAHVLIQRPLALRTLCVRVIRWQITREAKSSAVLTLNLPTALQNQVALTKYRPEDTPISEEDSA